MEAGEIFGFVGPNGAGKTTFLKCLIGVVRPDSGRAEVAGLDVQKQSLDIRRTVAYAPSETALYHRMKVKDLLAFAVAFHRRGFTMEPDRLLELFQLPPERKCGRLSHGMKRKLILSQALAVQAPVLLLDEPMEGLDPEVRRQVEELLRERAAQGTTIFFSSHDLASVERICHRVGFLRSGTLLEVGSLSELLTRASRRLHLYFRRPMDLAQLPQGPKWHWEGAANHWKLEFSDSLEQALAALQSLPLAGIRDASGTLEDVFDALYRPESANREAKPC